MKDHSQVDMAAVLGAGRGESGVPRRWLIAGVVALVAALALAWAMLSGGGEVRYRFADVGRGDITAVVSATGTLQPVNEVDLGPEISGQIDQVLVEFNDRVTAGQVLAVMDTDNLRARVLQSRASLTAARARVEDAKATAVEARTKLQRVQELHKQGNSSKQTLDSAEAAESRARANVGSAEAQVAVAAATLTADETTLSKAEIKSPINGIVLSRSVEPGQVVAATFQTPVLFKLAEDLAKMELQVNVDEADIGHVIEGQTATFTVDAHQDRQFPATITQVRFAPKTVDNVVTYQAVLVVDNSALLLRPGMTATANITTASRQNVVKAPNAALRFQPKPAAQQRRGFGFGPPPDFGGGTPPPPLRAGSTQHLWVVGDGAPRSIEVKVGINDGQFTEIVSGDIKPGDKVIIGAEAPAP